jgi:predicted esterase YcpF (UPF0227 family)
MKVLYLHGLGSSPAGGTVDALVAAGLDVFGLAYTPHDYLKTKQKIESLPDYDLVLGTSLGGYWALKYAESHVNSKVISINPVTDPATHFQKYVKDGFMNWATETREHIKDIDAFTLVSGEQLLAQNADIQFVAGLLDDQVAPQSVIDFASECDYPCLQVVDMGHRLSSAEILFPLISRAK